MVKIKAIHCMNCGCLMELDDKDITNRDNYDLYYDCPNCMTGCIMEVRHKRFIKEKWHSEENNEVRDCCKQYVDKT